MEPPPLPKKKSKNTLWIVAAAGFLVVVVCAVAAVVLLSRFLDRTAPVERIVGGESVGAIHLATPRGDPGMAGLARVLIREFQRAQAEEMRTVLPESMRWLANLNSAQSGAHAAQLTGMLPEALVVLAPGTGGGAVDQMIALRFRGEARLQMMFFTQTLRLGDLESREARRHRGHTIYGTEDSMLLALLPGAMLLADDRKALERALDRLDEEPSGEGEPDPLAEMIGREPLSRWDLAGRLMNASNRLEPVIQRAYLGALGPEEERGENLEDDPRPAPATDDIEEITFGLDVVTSDRLVAEMRIRCQSPESARLWQVRLRELFQGEGDGIGGMLGELAVDDRIDGSELLLELEASGLERLGSALLDRGISPAT